LWSEIGEAVVERLGRRATTIVIFAKDKDSEVLGLHALQGLGLEVNSVSSRLREVEAIFTLALV
jgi:predicted aspartyl protease